MAMTPEDFEEQAPGPSEKDIERSERKALESARGERSTTLWKVLALAIALIATSALVLNIFIPFFTSGSVVQQESPARTPARVVGVVNDTTLTVETPDGRQTVRYIGVEQHVPGSQEAEYAAAVSRDLVGGKEVLLEADEVERDGDVLLRYVIVDDTPVNLLLVAAGVARADLQGPNDRYRDLFRQFQQSARNQQLGIWSSSGEAGQSF